MALQALDVPNVALLTTGTDEWALRGLPIEKQATAAAPARPVAGGRAVVATPAEASAPASRV